jgi:phosphatidylserine decarboxylase
VVIEQTVEREYYQETRTQISIFMSPLDVHVNRSPVSGKVKLYHHHQGKYLVAWHPKSSMENERTTLVLERSPGVDILVRQIAGAVARRIKCYVEVGDTVAQGQEFGFIKFGSRVDVFLPPDAHINVAIGQHTTAGKTVIAKLP